MFRAFAAAGVLALSTAGVAAAQIPTTPPPPAQAAQVLQNAVANNPALASTIQARISQSGLTPDQVRARLQAAGYSPNLLDAYMSDSATVANSQLTPGANELSAIQALGLPTLATTDTITTKTGVVVQPVATPSLAGLPVFGVDVFKRSTTQFYPLLSGPVPTDYKLGPGDQLVLILTGDVEQTYQLQVTREGFVLIPQVGQVFVSNLTLDEARKVLTTRLGRAYSGVGRGTTKFDVSVANVRAVQVYVVGEVAQPGAYQISALGTVLTGLYAAGGVTGLANGRQIDVRRGGKSVAHFDLYDYLLKGDTRSDIRLNDGDVIFVPVKSRRVSLTGSVNRPAQYDLAPNETLTDLIREGGGLTADAAATRISITRIVPPAERGTGGAQRVVVDVPLSKEPATAGTIPPVALEDADSVSVFTVDGAVRNFVDLSGSVYLPGRFGWKPGMRLSDVVRLAGGLLPATYAGRAHIARWNPADSTRYLVSVELPRDSAAPWPADSVLHDRDLITIYGRPEMRDSVTVAITGDVNQPGRFQWRAGMTLRDLVLMARGTKPGAFLQYAEIARLPTDRSAGQLATTVRVPIDSTYLFDRDSLGRYVGPPGLAFPASGTPEVPIQPWDNVLIFRQPGFEFERTVTLEGQVKFPGTYALLSQDERLSSVVERAGGLTQQAYPAGVKFYRAYNNVGRINLDLPNALKHHGSRDDLILQPNDTMSVPEYQAVVKVSGAVNAPGSVLYKPGASLSYYISAAGGYNQKADERHASVRQANGEVSTRSGHFLFFGGGVADPIAGAEITVPFKDPNAPHTDFVALFGAIAQVMASTVTLIFVATKL